MATAEHKEKERLRMIQYRIDNKEQLKEKRLERYRKNPEKYKQSTQKYRDSHKEEIKLRDQLPKRKEQKRQAQSRNYYKNNGKEKSKEFRIKNKDRLNLDRNMKTNAIKDEILGDNCSYCNSDNYRLETHRIDGSKHENLGVMGTNRLKVELNSNEYIRVCQSCHMKIDGRSEKI